MITDENTGSGAGSASVPKCHGSATPLEALDEILVNAADQ